MHKNIKQIKMIDGDEIICEIVEATSGDFLIKDPLRIERIDSIEENKTIYVFRPYMVYQVGTVNPVAITGQHVTAMAIPDVDFLESYKETVKAFAAQWDEEGIMSEDEEEYWSAQIDSSQSEIIETEDTILH